MRRVEGDYYPHRIDRLAFPTENDPDLARVLVWCGILEVKIARLDPRVWAFRGGVGRISITTATPASLTWDDLAGEAAHQYVG